MTGSSVSRILLEPLQRPERKILQFGEKGLITVSQFNVMPFKQAAGLPWIGHVGGASGQAAKSGEDALFSPVTRQPVLVAHIREKAAKAVGKKGCAGCQLVIGSVGEGSQAGG